LNSVYSTTSTQQLLSYAKCVFAESEVYTGSKVLSGRKRTKEAFVYERVCYYWHQLLYETDRKSTIDQFPVGLSWFLFDIIIKSMVLKVHRSNELSDFTNRRGRFKEELFSHIGKILQKLVNHSSVSLETSIHVGSFLKDLLSVCDPNFVYPIIDETLTGFSQHKDLRLASMLRLTFLRVVLYHNDYVTLNLHSIPPPPSVYMDLNHQYRLASSLCVVIIRLSVLK